MDIVILILLAAFAPALPARPALVPLGLAAWIGTAVIAWAAAH